MQILRQPGSEIHSFLLRESGLSAIPDSLQSDIYNNHSCNICDTKVTPEEKSLVHHNTISKYLNIIKDITPPLPMPTEWTYKPPPIFIPVTANLATALKLQQILEYGITFQPQQKSNPQPFLSPFEHLLKLSTNTPPLTHFLTDNKRQATYDKYNKLLTDLKQALKKEQLSIVSCDKGPGLLLIENNSLQALYKQYLTGNAKLINSIDIIHNTLNNLKTSLLHVDIKAKITNTDDRIPTFYFKIKTHKTAFITTTTKFTEILAYDLGPKTLSKISRPVVNHKTSITTLTSQYLRYLITPIIENCTFLTQDIFETIDKLQSLGRPETIYTGDIEAFYPSTPHYLVLEAFNHYNPSKYREHKLLNDLLKFNYVTDGVNFFDMGEKGIPMGLPLAPELARMTTAFLLRSYQEPTGHILTLYFDDVAATYPIGELPLQPFVLKDTEQNQTQDALYNPTTQQFSAYTQAFRQCVPLHPHSHHPSRKLCERTYYGSAFRATQIGTNPALTLKHLLAKYLPALHRLGHPVNEVVKNMTEISYFPKRTCKEPTPYVPSITYAYSDTRPTIRQLKPIAKHEFKLIPIIPLAPLKGLLSYTAPLRETIHNVHKCTSPECINCKRYAKIFDANIPIPILPCTRIRCIYLLHHKNPIEPQHFYIHHTNLCKGELASTGRLNRIRMHLEQTDVLWQILATFPATFNPPLKGNTDKQTKWEKLIKESTPGAIIHSPKSLKQFYKREIPAIPPGTIA